MIGGVYLVRKLRDGSWLPCGVYERGRGSVDLPFWPAEQELAHDPLGRYRLHFAPIEDET